MLHARALSLESGEKTEEGGVNGGSYERAKAINKKKRERKNVHKARKPQTIKIHIKKLGSKHVQWNPVHMVTNGPNKIWLY